MAFTNNVLTSAGAQLIANATAGDPIIFSHCVSATTTVTGSSPSSSVWDGPVGTIDAASALDDDSATVRILAAISNQETEYDPLKSVGVMARLTSQSEGDEVCMVYVSDDDAGLVIPTEGPNVTMRVALLVSISNEDAYESIEATAAAPGDLDRFVSMYKAGNVTTGEAQTIYGAKTFSDSAHFASGLTSGGNVCPDADHSTYMLGTPDAPWYGGTFSGTLSALGCKASYFYPSDEYSYVGRPSDPFKDGYFAYLTVETFTAIDIYAYSGQTCVIGTESNPFDEAYISTVHADSLDGLIPYPTASSDSDTEATVPVGAFVAAYDDGVWDTLGDVTGRSYTFTASQVRTVTWNGSNFVSGIHYLPAGDYIGIGGGGSGFALLMRIA